MNGVCEDVGVFGFGECVRDEGGVGCCVCWVEFFDFWVGSYVVGFEKKQREKKRTEILGSITRDEYARLSYRIEGCKLEFRVGGHRFLVIVVKGGLLIYI